MMIYLPVQTNVVYNEHELATCLTKISLCVQILPEYVDVNYIFLHFIFPAFQCSPFYICPLLLDGFVVSFKCISL